MLQEVSGAKRNSCFWMHRVVVGVLHHFRYFGVIMWEVGNLEKWFELFFVSVCRTVQYFTQSLAVITFMKYSVYVRVPE